MKAIYQAICAGLLLCGTLTSCDDFIDVTPKGVISEELAMSQPNEMVTSAYAKLGDDWYTYPFNLWPYGDLTSDDALKGAPSAAATVPWCRSRNMVTTSWVLPPALSVRAR